MIEDFSLKMLDVTPDYAWIVIFIIFGIIIFIVAVIKISIYISEGPKRRLMRDTEKVKATSVLYQELITLNKSQKSLNGKIIGYPKTGYIFKRTYKEWLEYNEYEYYSLNKGQFEIDYDSLRLLINDYEKYKKCVDELWLKYAGNAEAVSESGLSEARFSEIESIVCKPFIIKRPNIPTNIYDITIECGYQHRKKHLIFTLQTIEEFRKKDVSESCEPTIRSDTNQTQNDTATPEMSESAPNNRPLPKETGVAESKPISAVSPITIPNKIPGESETQQETSNLISTNRTNEKGNQPASSVYVFNPPFERYFNSIENLDVNGFFWSRITSDEQRIIKDITRTIYDLKQPLIPINRLSIFGFNKPSSHDAARKSLFWFKKDLEHGMSFVYAEGKEPQNLKILTANTDNVATIKTVINEILAKIVSSDNNSPIIEQPAPAPSGVVPAVAEIKPKTDPVSTTEQMPSTKPAQTPLGTKHERLLARFPELKLDAADSFYGRLDPKSKEIVDSIALLATGLNKKIIITVTSSYFGFGKKDDIEQNNIWFGFRKRLGECLTFFYKENRSSSAVLTVIANRYQMDVLEATVRKIIHKDYSEPVVQPKQDKLSIVESPISSNHLDDPERFYYNCTPTERGIIEKIANLALSINKDIIFGNTKGYFGYKLKWAKNVAPQYWFWFKKPNGGALTFAYRKTQDDENYRTIQPVSTTENIKQVNDIVVLLLSGRPTKNETVSNENINTAPSLKTPATLAVEKSGYFYSRLQPMQKQTVDSIIKYVNERWPHVGAENTKNFLGFRKTGKTDAPAHYWFWFKESRDDSLQFVYRLFPDDTEKTIVDLGNEPVKEIIEILNHILRKEPIQADHCSIPASTNPPETSGLPKEPSVHNDFWSKPFLYAVEIQREYSLPKTIHTTEIAALCTTHDFSYNQGVAFSNGYVSLADAIYQSQIVNPSTTIYIYSNPYNCQAYDRALAKLMDELKLFNLGEGRFLTIKGLEKDYGITYSECHQFKSAIKRYLKTHQFFSIKSIVDHCSDQRFLNFSSSDNVIMQFIHSIFGRGVKTIVVDQDSTKAVYSTGLGEGERLLFFEYIMEKANSMDIYEIRDRVATLFEVNYELDLIGKDAEKVGFFYSDDLEKIYKEKEYFYKEIQG